MYHGYRHPSTYQELSTPVNTRPHPTTPTGTCLLLSATVTSDQHLSTSIDTDQQPSAPICTYRHRTPPGGFNINQHLSAPFKTYQHVSKPTNPHANDCNTQIVE